MNLTLARVVGLLAALGAAVTAYTGDVTSMGGYKAAVLAPLALIVSVWLHEEHATERNATTAAASLRSSSPAPPPMPSAADVAGVTRELLGGMLPSGGGTPGPSSTPADLSAKPTGG